MDATSREQHLEKQVASLTKEVKRLANLAQKYSDELQRVTGLTGAYPVRVRTKFAYLVLGSPSPNALNRDAIQGKYRAGIEFFNVGRGVKKPTLEFDLKACLKRQKEVS